MGSLVVGSEPQRDCPANRLTQLVFLWHIYMFSHQNAVVHHCCQEMMKAPFSMILFDMFYRLLWVTTA